MAFGSFFVKMSTTAELPWKPCKWDFWSTSQNDRETGLFKNKNLFLAALVCLKHMFLFTYMVSINNPFLCVLYIEQSYFTDN